MVRGPLAAGPLHAELGTRRRDTRKRCPSSHFSSGYQAPQVWRYRGTTLHSAPAEEEKEERRERRERVEESSSSRKAVPKANTSTARGLHTERAQRERVGHRMGAGRVAGRILVTSARRDNLATKVVEKDTLESSRVGVYKQSERA